VTDLAGSAPDPGDPTIVPIASALFFTLGWLLGVVRRWPRRKRQSGAEDLAALGGAIALGFYLFGLLTDLY
jgi:hypothetical protein